MDERASAPPLHSIYRATHRHLTVTICVTRAEKVSDLVLPHILGVSPCNYQPLQVWWRSVRHPNM